MSELVTFSFTSVRNGEMFELIMRARWRIELTRVRAKGDERSLQQHAETVTEVLYESFHT